MKKDEIFLGENGLTTTSASHIADLAKEFIRSLEEQIDGISFTNCSIHLMGSNDYQPITIGSSIDDLKDIANKACRIAEAKSLIAWLREGIKARNNLFTELEEMSVRDYCSLLGREYPTAKDIPMYTEDDEIAKLSIKDRNRYFSMQTFASTFGKIVHPNGSLSTARKQLQNKISNPNLVKGDGRDSIIYSYSGSVPQETVDEEYFKLQASHRAYQAEFNKMAHEISERVLIQQNKDETERMAALVNARTEKALLVKEFEIYKESEVQRLSKLKIIIPNELRSIYDTVNSLGSK